MDSDPSLITYLIIIILLSLSALFSGLTLGLMGLSLSELKRKADLGDKNAQKILPIRKKGNLLLTTLLIGNVAVNSVLSIFLGSITPGVIAALIATFLIVIFGEIIPQAIFYRHAMQLGAKFVPLVRLVMFILYPVTYPISVILDKTLGEELPTTYSKDEIIKLIEEHEDSTHSDIDEDEERIITGALTFSDKKVKDVMTPKDKVIFLSAEEVINRDFISKIANLPYSRYPVYFKEKDNIIGILHLQNLLKIDPDKKIKLADAPLNKAYKIREQDTLDDVLETFLKQKHHLFIVLNSNGEVTGLITLEDIIEEILKTEIDDEKSTQTDSVI